MSTPGRNTGRSVSPPSAAPSSFPSPSPVLSFDPDLDDARPGNHPAAGAGAGTGAGAGAAPSPLFNRLTFSLGFLPPAATTQTVSLYFDAEFVPQDMTLHAVFGPRGFVSCTSIPPTSYTPTPCTPYTAIDNNTVIDFTCRPHRSRGRVRLASFACCALFLVIYTAAVCALLLAAVGRNPPSEHEPLPVLSSQIPLRENMTNILRLHDGALAPLDSGEDDNDGRILDRIDSLYKEISNFCLLISEQAADMEAVEYINRVCGWAHEATGDLRQAWLRASRFRSDSMRITVSHWLQNLALALKFVEQQPYKGIANDTNTDKHVLSTVSRFLDPSLEQGLLPRSLQRGQGTIEAVLGHLNSFQDEIDRLVTLADEHNIQPDADAQPQPQSQKSSWMWPLLSSRNVEPSVMDTTNWTAAAIKGDKAVLAVHASRALARLVQAGSDAIAVMKPKATESCSRFRQAEEALNGTSHTLRGLLEPLMWDGGDGPSSVAMSKWSVAWNRVVDGLIRWASLLKREGIPRREEWWQLGTPWLTCGSGHGGDDGDGPVRMRDGRGRQGECGCTACWTLWYVPGVERMVDLIENQAKYYAL